MANKCFGYDALRGGNILLEFDSVIQLADDVVESASGLPYLAPGFIDLQVNGFDGVDYNSPDSTQEDIARSLRTQFAAGTTRLLPTVITGSREGMLGSLRNLYAAKNALPEGVAIEGFHVEGPHISAEEGPRGAHPKQHVRPPDVEEYRRWQDITEGHVKLVTLAPEWPEAPAYIEALVREGVTVAIGHTAAQREHIQAAVSAGATLSTHLGNGAHSTMARHPNYLWEQMAEDRLNADFIADGIHIGPAFLKVGLRAKGIERSILVTDASSPAGAKPGRYMLGDQPVDLTEDDRVVLAGQTRLAGSALRMHKGVENLMKLAGLTLEEALTMATRNPARVGRIAGRQRGLTPGDRADFVLFEFDAESKTIQIRETWIGGECFYRA
ncbi:MAG TPA: amidohydrolase family protein [Bryobacteraceae bacterium]|nr:amidohydrolase family protein [Bryobacteraceae bacterium]